VVRGVAWSVPVVSVAATAPAFAASPNVVVSQTACATTIDSSGDCGILIRWARLTWQVTTTLAIPAGTSLQVSWSRELHCRHNRVTGTLRTGGYVNERSTADNATSATYAVIKEIPPGTYTFEDGFAVQTGTPTVITLTIPTVPGEGKTSDNSAGRSLRTVLGATSCAS